MFFYETQTQWSSLNCMYNWLLGHEIREVSSERALYKYLTDGYRSSVRPVRSDTDSVDLRIGLYVNILEDLVRVAVAVSLYTVIMFVIARHFINILMM